MKKIKKNKKKPELEKNSILEFFGLWKGKEFDEWDSIIKHIYKERKKNLGREYNLDEENID